VHGRLLQVTGRDLSSHGAPMPQSKHRRKGKQRPRAYQTHAPAKNPTPSPPWVPVASTVLLVLGVLVILVGYLPPVSERLAFLPLLGSNWALVVGFVLLSVGFVLLTRWR
jgi:hypothetical protein